jgi:hypothetical protein
VGFGLQVGGEDLDGAIAVVKITAGQQPWPRPMAQSAQGGGPQQEGVAVVEQHSTAIKTAMLYCCRQGLNIWGRTHGRAGLDQARLLPEGLEGSVVEEQGGNGYG